MNVYSLGWFQVHERIKTNPPDLRLIPTNKKRENEDKNKKVHILQATIGPCRKMFAKRKATSGLGFYVVRSKVS